MPTARAAPHAHRGVSTSPTPTPSARSRSPRRWASCPRCASDAERGGAGTARGRSHHDPTRADAALVRLSDADGLIALAEPGGEPAHPEAGRRLSLRSPARLARHAGHDARGVEARPRRVAVGEFDGVHLGHREVIAGNDTVLTFEPHPLAVIRPQAAPQLLTSLEAKAELIAGLGVQELVVIPFDQSSPPRAPQEFIDEVLVGAAERDLRLGGGELPLRARRAGGHRACWPPTRGS